MPFLFEKLEVYEKALDFTAEVYEICRTIRDRVFTDQFRRAALSIPLNIAEGQGRFHNKEKRQFYCVARGSLLECVPLVQLCQKMRHLSENHYSRVYGLADELGRLLNGLIRSVRE